MLKLLFNEKFLNKLSERIGQVISDRLDRIDHDLQKELKAIRFDIKRLDEKVDMQFKKSREQYGLLRYQINNLEQKVPKTKVRPRETNSH